MAKFYTTRHRTPSVKTLIDMLGLSEETAQKVKDLWTGKLDIMSVDSARNRQAQAYNPHDTLTLALEDLNEIIGSYGVEYIASADDTGTSVYGIEYLNMGDTYSPTILFDHEKNLWKVCSWGDIVEREQQRFAE